MIGNIGVECKFETDGTVRIYRVRLEQSWISVEQGRQWVDQIGRHVLIMLPDEGVQEIHLRPDTLTWQLTSPEDRLTRLV